MNWLGKIFVVVIVFLSAVFMGMAMAVYATHQDFVAKVAKLEAEKNDLEAERDRNTEDYKITEANLQQELNSATQQSIKLQSALQRQETRNTDIQNQLNELKASRRDAIAAVDSTQKINLQLAEDNQELQTNIIASQEAADEAFGNVVEATSSLHDTKIKLDNTLEDSQHDQPEQPHGGRICNDGFRGINNCRERAGSIDLKLEKVIKEPDHDQDRDRCNGTSQEEA